MNDVFKDWNLSKAIREGFIKNSHFEASCVSMSKIENRTDAKTVAELFSMAGTMFGNLANFIECSNTLKGRQWSVQEVNDLKMVVNNFTSGLYTIQNSIDCRTKELARNARKRRYDESFDERRSPSSRVVIKRSSFQLQKHEPNINHDTHFSNEYYTHFARNGPPAPFPEDLLES